MKRLEEAFDRIKLPEPIYSIHLHSDAESVRIEPVENMTAPDKTDIIAYIVYTNYNTTLDIKSGRLQCENKYSTIRESYNKIVGQLWNIVLQSADKNKLHIRKLLKWLRGGHYTKSYNSVMIDLYLYIHKYCDMSTYKIDPIHVEHRNNLIAILEAIKEKHG